MTDWPVHARIGGPIVMIGFGSIGKGTLPLIERHFEYDKSRFVVIDPEDKDRKLLDERGIRFIHQAVTRDNYRTLLRPLLTEAVPLFERAQGVKADVRFALTSVLAKAIEEGAVFDLALLPRPELDAPKSVAAK